ncbi:MAG TPA: hypothetical protein VFX75_02365 [Nitrososphaeraceae archaeon]|nr:hypothetical protein [Nitrososphaeraceae archaeon]
MRVFIRRRNGCSYFGGYYVQPHICSVFIIYYQSFYDEKIFGDCNIVNCHYDEHNNRIQLRTTYEFFPEYYGHVTAGSITNLTNGSTLLEDAKNMSAIQGTMNQTN